MPQLMIEAAIVLGSVAVLLSVMTGFTAAGRTEDIKQRCVIANISAVEVIKKNFYENGDIDECVDFTAEDAVYKTTVTAVEEIEYEESVVYRLAVDTSHRGAYFADETELVTYLTAH
jgi:hypothetical protein